MARGSTGTTNRKTGRSTASPVKAAAKAPAPKKAAAKTPATRAPVLSKDELRAQVEKLERTVATLRTKSREATRAAKDSTARISELEEEVARLEKRVASQAASAKRSAKKSPAREPRSIDPGDAVPSGVAVQEPEPLDSEAEKALENLEHLSADSEAENGGAEQGGE